MLTPSPKFCRHRRTFVTCVAALLAGGFATASAAEGPYPGLPYHSELGGWAGAAQTGITEARKAKQWVQVPMQVVAAFSNNRALPVAADDPRDSAFVRTNFVYLVAPTGSEHNYGISSDFSVRTVAFGAVPVEASVQLIQRREDGHPLPIATRNWRNVYKTPPPGRPSKFEETDTVVEDALTVRVTRLVVDGVDLHLGNRCKTREPGALSLQGKGWWISDPSVDQSYPWNTGNYLPAVGGLLTGTIDVPAFTGCVTASGEDVSRLLTTTVSGPDNPVKIHASAPACNRPVPPATTGGGPPPPGAATPEEAGCADDRVPPMIPIP